MLMCVVCGSASRHIRGLVASFILLWSSLGLAQLPRIERHYIEGLPELSRPSDILQDSRGFLWFAYESLGTGLFVYDGVMLRHITAQPSDSVALPDPNVTSMLELPDGRIMMGSTSNGLLFYHPEHAAFSRIDLQQRVGADIVRVNHINEIGHGRFWLACTNGLVHYDEPGDSMTLFRSTLPEYPASRPDPNNAMHFTITDPLDSNRLWIGTLGGLLSFDIVSKSFKRHDMPFSAKSQVGLPNGQYLIVSLAFTDPSTLVCGSWAGGLLLYHTDVQRWEQIRDTAIMPEDDVYFDLQHKDDQHLWVISVHGLGVFSLTDRTFTFYDSVPVPTFYRDNIRYVGAMEKLGDNGFAVTGLTGGMIGHYIDAHTPSSNIFPPSVRRVTVNELSLSTQNNGYHDRLINLSSQEDQVSFLVVSPCYPDPDQVYYRYQMIGVDRTWRTQRGPVQAHYELSGGRYQFQYQSSLDGSTWVDGESWTVEKFSPVWQSREVRYVIGGLVLGAVLLYWLVTVRQRRKQREIEESFRHLLAESEMSALRAQMNPHFIFNSLNSIKMHVMKQDTQVANHYLTRFSHLMRLVLRNSKSKLITLSDELQALELYIEIEKLRFDNGFNSEIVMDPDVDPEALYIPPMLVQPYVENAIWHGLMHKKERGSLHIHVAVREDKLHMVIEDDGVGRAHKTFDVEDSTVKKSYGMRITSDRIALIKQSLGIDASVEVEDLHQLNGKPAGTRVHLVLPLIQPKDAKAWLDETVNIT